MDCQYVTTINKCLILNGKAGSDVFEHCLSKKITVNKSATFVELVNKKTHGFSLSLS